MDPDWRQQLQQAVILHRQGRLEQAIELYRAVLQWQPDHADALHLAGMALQQAKRAGEGLPLVEAAIRLEPSAAAYRNTLGLILRDSGDLPGARAAFDAALRLEPANAETHCHLARLDDAAGDADRMRRHFQAALQADPGYAGGQIMDLARRRLAAKDADAAQRLADLLDEQGIQTADRSMLRGAIAGLRGARDTAEAAYRAALAIAPDHPDSLRLLARLLLDRDAYADSLPLLERLHRLRPNDLATISALGYTLVRLGSHAKAIPFLRQVVEQRPADPGPWGDLANALGERNQFDEACDAYRRAIALDPERSEFYANLASLEARRGNLDDAEALCHEAQARNPDSLAARGTLANIRGLQKRFDEAEKLYAALLAEHPDDANSHNNLGIMRLRQGRFAEAWPHFAWRWQSTGWTTPDGSRGLPRWDGTYPPPGRLLLWREQGVGDEILYGSLLPDMATTGADVVVATDRRLVPLFARSFPAIQVVVDDGTLDPATLKLACQRPLGDLGSLMRPDAASFSRQPQGYLRADPGLRQRLRQRYRSGLAEGDLLVGVAWSSRNATNGRNKSIALTDMAQLFGRPGLQAVSLQYGQVTEDIARLQASMGLLVLHDAEIDPLASIDDQAAQIAALDLVVTISTAAAHLAAGLGLPTLLLLPDERGVLWYWGHQGGRTPWYASVRICRSEPGEPLSALLGRALPVWQEMVAAARQAGSR